MAFSAIALFMVAVQLTAGGGRLLDLHRHVDGDPRLGGGGNATTAASSPTTTTTVAALHSNNNASAADILAGWPGAEALRPHVSSLARLLALPHADECLRCTACVPQYVVDAALGNATAATGTGGAEEEMEEQQQAGRWRRRRRRSGGGLRGWLAGAWGADAAGSPQRQTQRRRLLLLVEGAAAAAGAVVDDGGLSGDGGARRRRRRAIRLAHWLQAAAAAAAGNEEAAAVGGAARTLLQQQLPLLGGPLAAAPSLTAAPTASGAPPMAAEPRSTNRPLDGVATHLAWLARQRAGTANTDTHAVAGVEVITALPEAPTFAWRNRTYRFGPSSLERDAAGSSSGGGGGSSSSSGRPGGEKTRLCAACRGCRQLLAPMPQAAEWRGSRFAHDPGASHAWMVQAAPAARRRAVAAGPGGSSGSSSGSSISGGKGAAAAAGAAAGAPAAAAGAIEGAAAAKVWCVPVPKPGTHKPAVCEPRRIREQLQLVLALQAVADDCGFSDDILPRAWLAPLDGVLPGGVGQRVRWDALMTALVDGVPLEALVNGGAPRPPRAAVLDLLQRRLNGTQLVRAAVFDLLTSQCDRHAGNAFVRPADGAVRLIDNDNAFGAPAGWRDCGVDSIFLPGTQKHEVARLGYGYVMKKRPVAGAAPPAAPTQRAGANPLQLLDYRCHVRSAVAAGGGGGTKAKRKGGGSGGGGGGIELGTSLFDDPRTKLGACLRRIAAGEPRALQARYGYPTPQMAAALHQRAKDLLNKGFEWTLAYGWPQNPSAIRYRQAKACCGMRVVVVDDAAAAAGGGGGGGERLECTDWRDGGGRLGWPIDLPAGDPTDPAAAAWAGGGAGGDTGSYDLAQELAGEPFERPALQGLVVAAAA